MLIALLAVLVGIIYSSWRIAVLLPLPLLGKALAVGLWISPFIMLALYFFAREAMSAPVVGLCYSIGTAWLIILLYVVGLFLLWDIARLFIPWLRPFISGSLMGSLSFFALVLSIFTYANLRYHSKVRVPLNITLDKPMERPLKIVMISDLHLGYTIGRNELTRWVKLINQEEADLILIAGDLVDGDPRPVLQAEMYQELNQLKARLGVYACLGNHEYIGGESQLGDSVHKVIDKTNIRLLRDEAVLVDNLVYIAGRDDRTNRYRTSTNSLLSEVDHSKPIILLDHQPYDLAESQEAGVDLQLSGHTHRGQVFPLNLIVDRMYERSHGHHQRGATHYYVSSGLGIWGGKFRLGTQSEYLVLTLSGKAFPSPLSPS